MLGYLSANIICSEKRTVFLERSSRKTVSFEKQNNVQGQISEHIFALNGGYCVYYPSNLFCNSRSFENWGIFSDILLCSVDLCQTKDYYSIPTQHLYFNMAVVNLQGKHVACVRICDRYRGMPDIAFLPPPPKFTTNLKCTSSVQFSSKV